jgi:CDP-diacylglycerol pyrophosphatase
MPTTVVPFGVNPSRICDPATSPARILSRFWLALLILILSFASGAIAQQPADGAPGCTHKNGRVCPRCDRDDLWIIVQRCLSGKAGCFQPEDSSRGYIVVKDISPVKPVAYLLIPSKAVTGVEDPQIFKEPVVDFWQYALEESQKHPGPQASHSLAMAINAECSRSEGEFHIHISCAHAGVVKTLQQEDSKILFKSPTTERFPGLRSQYQVIKVRSLTADSSPFEVVKRMLASPGDMQDQGIAVVLSEKPGEFYVLSTTYHDGAGGGGAEELLDQSCAEQ